MADRLFSRYDITPRVLLETRNIQTAFALAMEGMGLTIYPELFLYIPALLRNLGVSLAASVRVFELLINLATASVCYFSARSALGSRRIALGATMLYTLCSYRISNMYVRATMGESLAMIFFPLLLLAVYEVLVRDEKRWPLLALSMTGIVLSHLLSALFAVVLCALAAAICLPLFLLTTSTV